MRLLEVFYSERMTRRKLQVNPKRLGSINSLNATWKPEVGNEGCKDLVLDRPSSINFGRGNHWNYPVSRFNCRQPDLSKAGYAAIGD